MSDPVHDWTRRLATQWPDATPRELAELLWLASRVGHSPAPSVESAPPAPTHEPTSPPSHPQPKPASTPEVPAAPVRADATSTTETRREDESLPSGRRHTGRLTRPSALDTPLAWHRALHRLGGTTETGPWEVDLSATVTRLARTRELALVHRRRAEPAAALVLIEDRAAQLAPWREQVAQLVQRARTTGRWQRVVHLPLRTSASVADDALSPDAAITALRTLPPGDGALVIVLSDGIAAGWRDGTFARVLAATTARRIWAHAWGDDARPRHPWLARLPRTHPEQGLVVVPLTPEGLASTQAWVTGRGGRGLDAVRLPERAPAPRPGRSEEVAPTWHELGRQVALGLDLAVRQVLALAAGVPGDLDLELLRALGADGTLVSERVVRRHLGQALASGLVERVGGEGLVVRFRGDDVENGARDVALGWLDRPRAELLIGMLVAHLDDQRADRLGIPYALLRELEDGEQVERSRARPAPGAKKALRGLVRLTRRETPGVRAFLEEEKQGTVLRPVVRVVSEPGNDDAWVNWLVAGLGRRGLDARRASTRDWGHPKVAVGWSLHAGDDTEAAEALVAALRERGAEVVFDRTRIPTDPATWFAHLDERSPAERVTCSVVLWTPRLAELATWPERPASYVGDIVRHRVLGRSNAVHASWGEPPAGAPAHTLDASTPADMFALARRVAAHALVGESGRLLLATGSMTLEEAPDNDIMTFASAAGEALWDVAQSLHQEPDRTWGWVAPDLARTMALANATEAPSWVAASDQDLDLLADHLHSGELLAPGSVLAGGARLVRPCGGEEDAPLWEGQLGVPGQPVLLRLMRLMRGRVPPPSDSSHERQDMSSLAERWTPHWYWQAFPRATPLRIPEPTPELAPALRGLVKAIKARARGAWASAPVDLSCVVRNNDKIRLLPPCRLEGDGGSALTRVVRSAARDALTSRDEAEAAGLGRLWRWCEADDNVSSLQARATTLAEVLSDESPIVFLSYAREDAALVEELRSHLRPLEDEGQIRVWMDTEVERGEAWEERMRGRLTEAVVMVACVTPRFLASKWCKDEARSAREAGKAILPVHVSKFSARTDVFSDLQYVPDLSRPVAAWGDRAHYRDEPWSMVVDALVDLLERAERDARQARWTALVPPLVTLRTGKFLMGSPPGVGHGDEHPAHEVALTRPHAMGVTPVTQAQWQRVVAAAQAAPWAGEEPGLAGLSPNPSHFTSGAEAADRPVENVSWLDTVTWCNALSRLTGRRPAYQRAGDEVTWAATADGFRLPTEAEWEHACRAGTNTSWWHGDDEAGLAKVAWYDANANRTTHPVGKKLPNPWGLHDVHGNVWEWCWDCFDTSYYAQSPKADPSGPPRGGLRVLRGGSRWDSAHWCRSAYRLLGRPVDRSRDWGFRVVLSPPPEPAAGPVGQHPEQAHPHAVA